MPRLVVLEVVAVMRNEGCVTEVDGYNNDISPQVQSIRDDWEKRLVNENLARDIDGGSLNHYWIIKNMMGSPMEEMIFLCKFSPY